MISDCIYHLALCTLPYVRNPRLVPLPNYDILLTLSVPACVRQAEIDISDDDGRTPLHAAVDRGHTECVRALLTQLLNR